MLWLILMAAFFAVFLVALWRVSSGPGNEGAALGDNLPPEAVYPDLHRDRLGTPESIHPVESRHHSEG
jgi:hypothetical protein